MEVLIIANTREIHGGSPIANRPAASRRFPLDPGKFAIQNSLC
jgi:hypothetical protein